MSFVFAFDREEDTYWVCGEILAVKLFTVNLYTSMSRHTLAHFVLVVFCLINVLTLKHKMDEIVVRALLLTDKIPMC